jgi:hypothetical protein
MNNTDQIRLLLSMFATQLPTLLVCFVAGFCYSREVEGGLQGLDVGASWIRPRCGSLFCRSSRADCCARLGQSERPHNDRECICNGRRFDGVVSAARCHLRFTLDSRVCRALELASSIYASLINIRTPI